jgi:hypothetical protein
MKGKAKYVISSCFIAFEFQQVLLSQYSNKQRNASRLTYHVITTSDSALKINQDCVATIDDDD